MDKTYLPRIVDSQLIDMLSASGAVLIEGIRWCGKTRTAMQLAKSVLSMQDPDEYANNMKTAEIKPSLLLDGDVPRLLDEWQIAPVIWDAVRMMVDKRNKRGQFILTGSFIPPDGSTMHTGTRSLSRFKMRTMSLYESKESNGQVSLSSLFNKIPEIYGFSDLTIEKLALALIRGGWPQSVNDIDSAGLTRVYDYLDTIINQDINKVDGIRRDPTTMKVLMKSLCSLKMANNRALRRSIEREGTLLSLPTIISYINVLKRIHVIEDLPAWTPGLRSKTVTRRTVTRHFSDPSIIAALLLLDQNGLKKDFNKFNLLFESLCIRDLRIYMQAIDGEVFHYKDKNNLEIDIIAKLRDGRWGGIDIRMGSVDIDVAVKSLLKLKSIVKIEPSFLMVLTATNIAYCRNDGVYVVPIGCLKP
jgi:predicted AAA+ superfamily ATPase